MTLREGELIGPYQIIAQLGQGGMATVYKGYHPQLDRNVAIKVMHQSFLEDATFRARFEREAQIVARLEHPHIVPVYDYNQHNGQPYLVMKFIEGDTLKQSQFKGTLPLAQIVHVMTAVASALSYAHSKGVLHRDVKPSNVVIDKDNVPYLTDFGLARIAQAGESTMSADIVLGTPHYISPEQARGEKNLDGRADIYSFGIVLYELLVGRVPFTADTPYAIIHDHIYTPLPLPSLINPELPATVEMVLLRALEKDPAERYRTAAEMMEDFKRAVHEIGLTDLNPARASIASNSLAKYRENTQSKSVVNQTSTPIHSIPSPSVTPIAISLLSPTSYQTNVHQRFWKLSGCAAFILIGLVSISIGLNIFDNILQIAEITNDESGRNRFNQEVNRNALIYEVPDISIPQAQDAIITKPNDPVGYLALAKAFWQENNINAGYEAIQKGIQVGPDTIRYLMTATFIADETGQTTGAISIGLLVTNLSEQANDKVEAVRTIIGEYIYDTSGEITSIETSVIIQIQSSLGYEAESIVVTTSIGYKLLTARYRLVRNQPLLAQRALNNLSEHEKNRPETRLIQGELYLKEGATGRAITELTIVAADPTAPDWVRQKATSLLENIGE